MRERLKKAIKTIKSWQLGMDGVRERNQILARIFYPLLEKMGKEREKDINHWKNMLSEGEILGVWKHKGELFWKKARPPKTEKELDEDFSTLARGLKVVMKEQGAL